VHQSVIADRLLVLRKNDILNVTTLCAFSSREELRNLKAKNEKGEDIALGEGTIALLWKYIEENREKKGNETGPATKRLRRDAREPKDEFLAALPLAKLEGENVMRFEREMYFTHDQIVFTRQSYHSLYPIILERVRKGGKCVTTGTPGIGNSFFGYFAVRKLWKMGLL
jgi:hypothetical protein